MPGDGERVLPSWRREPYGLEPSWRVQRASQRACGLQVQPSWLREPYGPEPWELPSWELPSWLQVLPSWRLVLPSWRRVLRP